jgi:hypothetical protein
MEEHLAVKSWLTQNHQLPLGAIFAYILIYIYFSEPRRQSSPIKFRKILQACSGLMVLLSLYALYLIWYAEYSGDALCSFPLLSWKWLPVILFRHFMLLQHLPIFPRSPITFMNSSQHLFYLGISWYAFEADMPYLCLFLFIQFFNSVFAHLHNMTESQKLVPFVSTLQPLVMLSVPLVGCLEWYFCDRNFFLLLFVFGQAFILRMNKHQLDLWQNWQPNPNPPH